MTPDEVLNTIKKISEIEFTRATLTKYENWNLISKPVRGGGGRGIGRWTNYPEIVVAEAVAAYLLINGKYDFPVSVRPKLTPVLVLSGKLRAVRFHGGRNHFFFTDHQDLAEKDEIIFFERNDESKINKSVNAFIQWVSMVWENEYRKAWSLYCSLK